MRKILYLLVLGLFSILDQAAATDSQLRHRLVASQLPPELSVPLVPPHIVVKMPDKESDAPEIGTGHRNFSPELLLAINHGDMAMYYPESVAEAKRSAAEAKKLRQWIEEDRLQRHFQNPYNLTPLLAPEAMADFPGVPEYLKLPKDYFLGLFLYYVDKETAFTLRQCCKTMYLQLLRHKATSGYFLKVVRATMKTRDACFALYQLPSIFNHWQHLTLWQAVPQLKALRWFKEQHPLMDLEPLFNRLEDYEWCPRVLFDPGYWRMKRDYGPKKAAAPWSRKIILATHGGDNLGNLMYFGLKMTINAGLFAANIYFQLNRPTVVPQTCHHIYSFAADSFMPSIDARHTTFNWIKPYRELSANMPFMALLFKDLYMLISGVGSKLNEKDKLLHLQGRWPFWKKSHLPLDSPRIEFVMMNLASVYSLMIHPRLLEWAIPLNGPFKGPVISLGNFTQLLTTNATNSSWMEGCCMMVGKFVQPGCFVPWGLDAAKEVVTYSVHEVASQSWARVANELPLIMVCWTWTFYYFVIRQFLDLM